MPRNRIWPYIVTIGLGASCAPRPKLVYVNVDAAISAFVASPVSKPQALPSLPPLTLPDDELPNLPKRTVTFPVTRDRLDAAREIVKKSEDQALKEIARRLRETYLAEVHKIELERMRELDPSRQSFTSVVYGRILEIFNAYAKKRGPSLIRLTFLVGFPDPDPLSTKEPESNRARAKKRFAEAKELRTQIATLDKEYDEAVKRELNTLQATNDSALTTLKVDIEELRSKAERQAITEAQNQMNSGREQIESLLIGDPSVTLSAIREKKVAFPSAPPVKNGVRSLTSNLNEGEVVRIDLAIWLAQKGYILGTRLQATDVTKDFIAWRKKQLVGH